MDPYQNRLVTVDIPHCQCQMCLLIDGILISDKPEFPKGGGHNCFRSSPDKFFLFHAILNEISNGHNFHAVFFGKFQELRYAGHCPIFIHNLADNPCGINVCQLGYIDDSLRMACPAQYAPVLSLEGKNMPRTGKVLRPGIAVDQFFDRLSPFKGRNSRTRPFGIHRDSKGCFPAIRIVRYHQGKIELLDAFRGEGNTDKPPAITSHKIYCLRGCLFGGQHQISFIFSVFVIDDDKHLSFLKIFNGFIDRIKCPLHFLSSPSTNRINL